MLLFGSGDEADIDRRLDRILNLHGHALSLIQRENVVVVIRVLLKGVPCEDLVATRCSSLKRAT